MQSPDSLSENRSTGDALLAEARCAHCNDHQDVHSTGQHYLCRACWREIFNEEPPRA